LFLEAFGPTFHYIKGKNFVIADTFSHLPQRDSLKEKSPSISIKNDSFAIKLDHEDMLECFLNYPDPNEIPYPLDYALIHQHQINNCGL
jgi:hypothetical protein